MTTGQNTAAGPARTPLLDRTVNIQQILRAIIVALWLLANVFAIFMDHNVYVNTASLIYANLLFLTFFLLAWSRHIVTVLYTMVGVFFVLQRIPFIFLDASNIISITYYPLSAGALNSSMLFVVLCNLIALFLLLTVPDVRHFDRSRLRMNADIANIIKFFPFVFIAFAVMKIAFMLATGQGLSITPGNYQWGVPIRLLNLHMSITILLFVGFFIFKEHRKWFIIAILFNFLHVFFTASKAGLLSIAFLIILSYMFAVSYRFKVRHLALCAALVLLTVFVYGPLMTIFRSSLLAPGFELTPNAIVRSLVYSSGQVNVLGAIGTNLLSLSQRMALLEWLTCFIELGRDAFTPNMNFHHLFVTSINTLVPGELIQDNYMPIAKFINLTWKGWSAEWQGENAGLYGSFYVFGGFLGGLAIFAACYIFFSVLVRRTNVLYSCISLTFFFEFLLGGISPSIFHRLGSVVVTLLIVFLAFRAFRIIKRFRSRPGTGSMQFNDTY